MGGGVTSSVTISDGVAFVGARDGYVYALDVRSGEERWRYRTRTDVLTSPLVSNGLVFVGSADSHVYALDAASGDVRWQYKTGGSVESDLVIVKNTIYVGSRDGYVHALDAAPGSLSWRVSIEEFDGFSPQVANGKVYVSTRKFADLEEHYVYALDAASGELSWRYGVAEAVFPPAVSNGMVYFATWGRHVYALDATTGDSRWTYRSDDILNSAPIVGDGHVYVASSEGFILALDALSGKLHWQHDTGYWLTAPYVEIGGVVYARSQDDSVESLDALDGVSGELLWRLQTVTEVSSLSIVDGVVYAGTRSNAYGQVAHVFAVDASTGEELWRFETGEDVWDVPTVVDGVVYVGSWGRYGSRLYGSPNAYTYALDAKTGNLRWRFKLGDAVRSPLSADATVLYAGAWHSLYALDARTGERRWRRETNGLSDRLPSPVDGVIYVGLDGGRLYALEAQSGEERWSSEHSGLVTPAVMKDGVVYAGALNPFGNSDAYLVAIDAAHGKSLWHFGLGRPIYNPVYAAPAVAEDLVYVGTESGRVYAIDTATGSARWQYDVDGRLYAAPTVVEGTVFVGSWPASEALRHSVYALNAKTGELRWRSGCERIGSAKARSIGGLATSENPPKVLSSITVSGGLVYFGSNDNQVHSLDADTGKVRWCYRTGGSVEFSPTLADGVAYVVSTDNYAYALDAMTGEALWHYRIGSRAASAPMVIDGTVFIALENGTVIAISPPGNKSGNR